MKGSIIRGRKHTHSQGGGRAPGPYSDSGYGSAECRVHARISVVAVWMRGPHTDPDTAEHLLGASCKQTCLTPGYQSAVHSPEAPGSPGSLLEMQSPALATPLTC